MANREDELMDQRHQEVIGAISGVHVRLDQLNGRTRSLENKVSVLQWAYGLAAFIVSVIAAKFTGQQQ